MEQEKKGVRRQKLDSELLKKELFHKKSFGVGFFLFFQSENNLLFCNPALAYVRICSLGM